MGIGQIVSLVGSALVQFALVWYVTKETGSATVLATATTAPLVPNILIGPFVGALVDRWNRKLVMIIADLVVALATVILAVLFATGAIQTGILSRYCSRVPQPACFRVRRVLLPPR
jgi:DHA3 family macrolide efflux protein-like MFS transporter